MSDNEGGLITLSTDLLRNAGLFQNPKEGQIIKESVGVYAEEEVEESEGKQGALVLGVRNGRMVVLYGGGVFVIPAPKNSELKPGNWICFDLNEKNRLSSMYDAEIVADEQGYLFPTAALGNCVFAKVEAIKRNIYEYPHKDIFVMERSGRFDRRRRYPMELWSEDVGFMEDPKNLLKNVESEKALDVRVQLRFDWELFEKSPGYKDRSKFLKTSVVAFHGYSANALVVAYSPWRTAETHKYPKTPLNREPEYMYQERARPEVRFSGLLVGEKTDAYEVWSYRHGFVSCGKMLLQNERTGEIFVENELEIGTFVLYSVFQRVSERIYSLEGVQLEVHRKILDVRTAWHGKEVPEVCVILHIPTDIENGKIELFHDFCGYIILDEKELEMKLKEDFDATLEDVRGREVRIWMKLEKWPQRNQNAWEIIYWRFRELGEPLFLDRPVVE